MECSITVIARGQVGTTVAMASEDPKLQEAIAFLQSATGSERGNPGSSNPR